MSTVQTYDISEASASFNGSQMTGFMEGTFVSVELTEPEQVRMKEGADGETAFIRAAKKGAKATVTLMHTSDSNRVLRAAFYLSTKAVFEFEDSLGNRVMARQAMIEGIPPITAADGDGPDGRAWVFLLPNCAISAPATTSPVQA